MSPQHGDSPIPSPSVARGDLNGLARKLDELNLSGSQKVLLSAIVAAAARAAVELTYTQVPSFRDQFASSFTPETAARLISMNESHRDIIDEDPPPRP